jgi:hypothetical protein
MRATRMATVVVAVAAFGWVPAISQGWPTQGSQVITAADAPRDASTGLSTGKTSELNALANAARARRHGRGRSRSVPAARQDGRTVASPDGPGRLRGHACIIGSWLTDRTGA